MDGVIQKMKAAGWIQIPAERVCVNIHVLLIPLGQAEPIVLPPKICLNSSHSLDLVG